MLIAGRCRRSEESKMIREVLELNFKKNLCPDDIFNGLSLSSKDLSEKVFKNSLIYYRLKHIPFSFSIQGNKANFFWASVF